jgi:CBS domain-containing protein
MNVEKIMTRGVKTCGPEDTLWTAAQIMWEKDCGCVPVVKDGKVVGMITDRDICMAAWTQDARLSELSVSRVCSQEPLSCGPGDPVAKAEELMRTRQVRRLPVVDENRLVGIVSLNDIARSAANARARKGVAAQTVTAAQVGEALAEIGRPRQQTPARKKAGVR